MSDVMLFGVLRQPIEMAFVDDLSRQQFHARAQEACARIERLESDAAVHRFAEEKAREALRLAIVRLQVLDEADCPTRDLTTIRGALALLEAR